MTTKHQKTLAVKNIRLSLTIILIIIYSLIQISSLWGGTTGKLKGKINDAKTGEPITAVSIVEKDAQLFGCATDLEGRYMILNIPPGKYDLEISCLGYHTVIVKDIEIIADSSSEMNVGLPPSKPFKPLWKCFPVPNFENNEENQMKMDK